MQKAIYTHTLSGYRFCVMTRDDADIAHVEKTLGCVFVRWL